MLLSSLHLIDLLLPLLFFFFNDTATTEIYTLSLHDALPIFVGIWSRATFGGFLVHMLPVALGGLALDRKSTRLNSSHSQISYAVFCLKKKKNNTHPITVLMPLSQYRLHPYHMTMYSVSCHEL